MDYMSTYAYTGSLNPGLIFLSFLLNDYFIVVRLLQRYERIEYRGDWAAQYLKADIVGCPGQGVPIALYEAKQRY